MHIHRLLPWLIGIGWFLLTSPLTALATTFSTSPLQEVTIGKDILYLEDPTATLTLDDVRSSPHDWQFNDASTFSRGYNASAWWLKLRIANPHAEPQWLLEIAYPVLDHLEVHVVRAGGDVRHFVMGDKQPFQARPIINRHFVVPLALAQDEQVDLYLRVQSSSSVQVPIRLWNPMMFYEQDTTHNVIEGVFYGGLLIIALYNLLLFVVLKDLTYLFYVGSVLSRMMFVACLNGWAFRYFWPAATQWNDTAIMFFLALALVFGWGYSTRFLNIYSLSRVFRILNTIGITYSFIVLGVTLSMPYAVSARVVILFAVTSCVWGMTVGITAWRRGNTSARYFIMAWSILLISGVILAMSKNHLLPSSLYTEYAIQTGSMVEVLLLSFALAARINQERALRHQAQQAALDTQRHANEALESRVQERTLALEQANQKLQELSDTDQLTGLKNRRFLNLHIEKEFARAQRYRHPFTVLMIDVDHFKSINDTYGHPVGDDCLQEVANRIRQQMRWPSDLSARYGGEEFCVVLPETNSDGALIVAERIRGRIEAAPIPTRSHPLPLTVSVGLHTAIPDAASAAAEFIAQADAALYRAKQGGRNRVVSNAALTPAG